jgi:outer membrane protein TolC
VELAERLLTENRKRVEVGAMAPLDEKQAEAQTASSKADLVQARNAVAILEDTLKNLITDEYITVANVTFVPTDPLKAEKQFLDRQDSWSKGLAQRPDFQQAKLQLENAGIRLKFAKNQLLPQVDLFGTFGYNGSGYEFSDSFGQIGNADSPYWTVGGAISVPLGNTAARNSYKTSKAQREQAVLSVKRIEQQIMVEIDDAIKQAQSSYQRVGAYRAAREFAAAALDAEQKKLESGKSTSFEVLRLQRDLTTTGGDEIRALAEYNRALARLRQFEGATLQYRGIDIEVKP